MLRELNAADALDACRVVRARGTFRMGEHFCVVMEQLGTSLASRLRVRFMWRIGSLLVGLLCR